MKLFSQFVVSYKFPVSEIMSNRIFSYADSDMNVVTYLVFDCKINNFAKLSMSMLCMPTEMLRNVSVFVKVREFAHLHHKIQHHYSL